MGKEKNNEMNVDEYILGCPLEVQDILTNIRQLIRENVPKEATEKISYGMPTFYLYGNLVHFSAAKNHIGFYPTPSGVEQFKDELTGYKTSKGAIQFPLDKPIPYDLIKEITLFRVEENLNKESEKKSNK